MGFPKGNEFWKLRSKHGRDLIFSSSEILEEACIEYFEVTSKRVWADKHWIGKDANEVEKVKSVPFQMTGLWLFLGIDRETWANYKKRDDFFAVITWAESVVYTQKFEGAVVGDFDSRIIARDLGLADKRENNNKNDGTTKVDLSGLPTDILRKLLNENQ